MRRTFIILAISAIILACLVPFAAAGTTAPDNNTIMDPDISETSLIPDDSNIREVTDSLGTTVTITGTPQRIVSLAPSNTELLGSLNIMDRVVGVTVYCNYPPEALEISKIGGFSTVNVEKVVALKPDLILAEPKNGQQIIDRLRNLGFPVIVLQSKDVNDILTNMQVIGEVTQTSTHAEEVIDDLQVRLDTVERSTHSSGTTPTVAHILSQNPIYVSGNNTYQNDIIRLSGGRNAFGNVESWGTVTLEELLLTDPDYILVNAGTGMVNETTGTNPVYDYFMHDPRTQRLKAVRQNHFILVETNTLSRGGARTIDAVELIARAIHPDGFLQNASSVPIPTSPPRSSGFPVAGSCFALMAGLALRIQHVRKYRL